MEIGKRTGVIVIGPFVIGGLIALAQLGLTKVRQPPWNGTLIRTLRAGFRKNENVDPSERLGATREGRPADEPLLVYAANPDFSRHSGCRISLPLWVGDMLAQGEVKRGPLVDGALCPDAPSVTVNDALDCGQADAGPRKLALPM